MLFADAQSHTKLMHQVHATSARRDVAKGSGKSSGPVTSTEGSGVDRFDLGCERFAEDRFVVVVEDAVAKPGRDFHGCREDAKKLLETRGAEFRFDGIGAEHARVDGTISFRVELADVEEVGVSEERAAADDDPGFSPIGNFTDRFAAERLFGREALAREQPHPLDGSDRFDIRGIGCRDECAVSCGNP